MGAVLLWLYVGAVLVGVFAAALYAVGPELWAEWRRAYLRRPGAIVGIESERMVCVRYEDDVHELAEKRRAA